MKKILMVLLLGLSLTSQSKAGIFDRQTDLHKAVSSRDLQKVLEYFRLNANKPKKVQEELDKKNKDGYCPLIWALMQFDEAPGAAELIAKLLISKEADVLAVDNSGTSVLHLMVITRNVGMVGEVVRKIKDQGGNIDCEVEVVGDTPLHYATVYLNKGSEERREILSILLKNGADPHKENYRGRTPASRFTDEEREMFAQYLQR